MTPESTLQKQLRAFVAGPGPGLVLAAAVFATLLWINRSERIFEFDPDEGNNVIKTLLVREGYAYGTEIWTDQPPLFSYLLLPAFQVFGSTMDVARGTVSLFSALLCFGLYEVLRRGVGHLGALLATGLLLSSALYVLLSVSVMIGLPSVACLVLAVLLSLECGRRGGHGPLAWSFSAGAGGLAAAAMGIKLFALPVIPIVLFTVALSGLTAADGPSLAIALRSREAWRRLMLRVALFAGGFAVVALLAFAPLISSGTSSGLVETHQVAREQAGGQADGLSTLRRFITDDPLLFVLALQGALVALARQRWRVLPWLGWFLFVAAALVDHSPIWPHHRLLLTVPAAALAGHALFLGPKPALPAFVRTSLRVILPALAAAAVAFSVMQKGRLESMLHPKPWTNSDTDWKIFAEFSRFAQQSTMVAAARPTYAFRADRPVPPDLAVTSWKRFRVGLLSPKRVASDVAKSTPETILFSSRWPGSVRAAVEKKIKKTHRRVKRWRHQSSELWVDKRLLSRMNETAESTDRGDDNAP